MVNTVHAWRFPPPNGGIVEVTYPFVLERATEPRPQER